MQVKTKSKPKTNLISLNWWPAQQVSSATHQLCGFQKPWSIFLAPFTSSVKWVSYGSVTHYTKGFPGGSVVKNLPATAGDVEEISSIPGLGSSWKIPWRRARQPTPIFLPGKPHGQRSLVGHSSWGHKNRHDWTTDASNPLPRKIPLLQGEGSPTLP